MSVHHETRQVAVRGEKVPIRIVAVVCDECGGMHFHADAWEYDTEKAVDTATHSGLWQIEDGEEQRAVCGACGDAGVKLADVIARLDGAAAHPGAPRPKPGRDDAARGATDLPAVATELRLTVDAIVVHRLGDDGAVDAAAADMRGRFSRSPCFDVTIRTGRTLHANVCTDPTGVTSKRVAYGTRRTVSVVCAGFGRRSP